MLAPGRVASLASWYCWTVRAPRRRAAWQVEPRGRLAGCCSVRRCRRPAIPGSPTRSRVIAGADTRAARLDAIGRRARRLRPPVCVPVRVDDSRACSPPSRRGLLFGCISRPQQDRIGAGAPGHPNPRHRLAGPTRGRDVTLVGDSGIVRGPGRRLVVPGAGDQRDRPAAVDTGYHDVGPRAVAPAERDVLPVA